MKPVVHGILLWIVVISLQSNAFAETAEKIKAYAGMYPDLFIASMQQTSGPPPKGSAYALLVKSFNEATDFEELSNVLKPSEGSGFKNESQIKQLVSARGLSWDEYIQITHSIATDNNMFEAFYGYLDKTRMKKALTGVMSGNTVAPAEIGNTDHIAIVRNVVEQAKKPAVEPAIASGEKQATLKN